MHQTHSLVIGAASGMGRCIAKRLAKVGKLTIADKNLPALNELLPSIKPTQFIAI